MLESTKINKIYNKRGINIIQLTIKDRARDINTKKTKNSGNQNVIFEAFGCHLLRIGRTKPNFFTCI